MKSKQTFVGQKWKLRSGLLYAGVGSGLFETKLVGPDEAVVFDSRDNRELKQRYYSAVLGVPFEVEEV